VVGVQGGLAPLARELGVDGLFPEAGAVVGWNLLEFDPEDLLQRRPGRRVTRADAEAMLREEAELMRIVDTVAATAEEFEELASAIEGCDIESLPEPLREAALKEGLAAVVDGEIAPPRRS
jgi:hypothetical protein